MNIVISFNNDLIPNHKLT